MRPSALCLLLVLLCTAPAAVMAEPQPAAEARAQALFQEARVLMKAGAHATACPKLAESYSLSPAVGTRFHLADCYETIGKLASAYEHFAGVALITRSAGQRKRSAAADKRAAALEPRLSRLTIATEEAPAGAVIAHDGESLARERWQRALPVDGGTHLIEARADGYQPFQQQVFVPAEGGRVVVQIQWRRDATPADSGRQTATDGAGNDGGRSSAAVPPGAIAGFVFAGVGVVGVVVGAVFASVAIDKKNEAEPLCPTEGQCFQRGVDLHDEAVKAADIATVALAVGGGLAALGVVLIASAPWDEEGDGGRGTLQLAPLLGGSAHRLAGLRLRGSW